MKNLSLRKKLIAIIVLPVIICTSIIVLLSTIKIHNQGIADLIDKSNAILGINILEYTQNHTKDSDVTEMDVEKSIMGVTSEIVENAQQYKFRISSPNPVNAKHLATKQDLEFINKFTDINIGVITHIDKENNDLMVIRPVFMDEKKGCLECHAKESGDNSFGDLRGVFMVVSDMEPIQKQVNASIFQSFTIGIVIIVLAILLAFMFTASFVKPIMDLKNITENLAIGDLKHNFKYDSNDEIGIIGLSFNKLIQSLNKTAEFSNEIGKGNFSHEYHLLSDKDTIGKSLLNMRDSLLNSQNNELARKEKDEQEKWVTNGLAKFSEILRTNSTKINELSFNILSNLINYLDVNQGALFIIDDSDENQVMLELKSAIAYGRDKYLKKRVGIGEELVGRCAFEKRTIYMTDIPKNYIQITSGMGTANPSALLLVPLILNDESFGVIELASFHPIEKYRIEFIEKLGESIASTIAAVKVNEKTSRLLEQSKSQSEELAAQEEEMRQNLEELQATQEEAARREFEMAGIVKALGTTAFIVEYDLEGVITSCNVKYAEMLGLPQDQIVGQKHSQGYEFTPEMKANYNLFWGDLRRGIQKRETNRIVLNNKEFWFEETYTPITSQHEDKPYKILKIGFNITEQKLKEQQMIGQEIKIKKEKLLLSEYQTRLVELQNQLAELNKLKEKQGTVEGDSKAETGDSKKIKNGISGIQIIATNDNLLDWIPEFETGIRELDEQHQQLLTLVNLMHASFKLEKSKKEIKENIRGFADFAAYHFGNEESYFEKFKFEHTKEHVAEHKQFIKEVSQFQLDYSANKLKELETAMDYFKNWLFHHFTIIDNKYSGLFKEKGL